MTAKTHSLPRPGETVLGGVFTMGAGGKGANQAVAAQRLGGDVQFICKVGRDMFGDNAVAQYKAEGLDVSGVLRSSLPSGVALIYVDDSAENCIVVASGANGDLSEADIDASREAIAHCGILLLQLEIPIPSVLKAAKMAHEAGAMVVLNPAPACPLPEELFRYVDLFIPNETELSTFSGLPVTDAAQARRRPGPAGRRCHAEQGRRQNYRHHGKPRGPHLRRRSGSLRTGAQSKGRGHDGGRRHLLRGSLRRHLRGQIPQGSHGVRDGGIGPHRTKDGRAELHPFP